MKPFRPPKRIIRHLRYERGTAAEMHHSVSKIVTWDMPVSHWPFFFFLSLVTVPEVIANVSFCFVKWWIGWRISYSHNCSIEGHHLYRRILNDQEAAIQYQTPNTDHLLSLKWSRLASCQFGIWQKRRGREDDCDGEKRGITPLFFSSSTNPSKYILVLQALSLIDSFLPSGVLSACVLGSCSTHLLNRRFLFHQMYRPRYIALTTT